MPLFQLVLVSVTVFLRDRLQSVQNAAARL